MSNMMPFKIHQHISEYGDIQLYCSVHITRGIHDPLNEKVLHQICALMNCGGGMIVMQNEDIHKNVYSKDLDLWWSGIENKIATTLSQDDICNFVDFVGDFDSKFFYLFVKSAEHLCTTDYCCRLPTDTATHEVSYNSVVALCRRRGKFQSLDLLPPIPSQFVYGKTLAGLKQEGKQIQFKFVTSRKETNGGKTLAHKVSSYSSRYISAFANHEGGHIYFGIEDGSAGVYGEEMNGNDENTVVETLVHRMKSIIWGSTGFAACKGVHWDVCFVPVFGGPLNERRKVIVVSVSKMYGAVFTSCPESYIVLQPSGDSGHDIRRLEFDEWKSLLLNQSRDCPSLHSRFVKLPLLTPQCRLTFSLPQTPQSIREKVIKLSTGFNLHPKNFLYSFNNKNLKDAINKLITPFAEEEHIVIALDSWGLSQPSPSFVKPQNVLACLAIFSSVYGLHVVSLVDKGTKEENTWKHTKDMALGMKYCLVNHGGCNCHLGIGLHVLDITSPIMLELFQDGICRFLYPQTYYDTEDTMNHILRALTIAIASYKPFGCDSQDEETDYYFLLTCDQLELLWTHQFTKELWIHGPPGAGKTVAALKMVKELCRRGCNKNQVLYVVENSLICSYVSSFDICQVIRRRELMADVLTSDIFNSKYKQIKNVIVDEAQNFKSRDGDWYSVVEKLSLQNIADEFDMTAGYFWVFLDYAQKVHKFEAGLPGLIGKNNFMLSEISRNSKEIFEYASKFMENSSSADGDEVWSEDKGMQVEPVLGHQFSSGQDVTVVKCDKGSLHESLYQVLKGLSENGVELSDIAILVSKKKDTDGVKDYIDKNNLENKITAGSVPSELSPLSLQAGVGSALTNVSEVSSSVDSQAGASKGNQKACKASEDVDIEMSDNSLPSKDLASSSPFQGSVSSDNDTVSKSNPIIVSTVRDFSGLDKPVVVGVEPQANPDHADLDKLIANLATRAKDSLVILTSSDEVMDKLNPS